MPSQKQRSMEDTWKTDELNKALNSKSGERRHHRDRDDDRKREKIVIDDRSKDRRRDDDDRRRRHRRDEEDVDVQLSEGDRERMRRERRERKEKDGKGKKGEIQFRRKAEEVEIDDEEEEPRRRHHGDRGDRHRNGEDGERRRKHHDDEDRDKRRRHRDDDNDDRRRRHRDEEESDRKRRHRDEDDDRRRKHRDDDDEDERERRRRERRKEKEREDDEERRRRHEEKKERRREEDRERRKDKDENREERSDRHRDRKDRDRDRESEKDREKRKEREREERRREREEQKRREKEEEERRKKEEEEQAGGEDEYEEDFEDYEEDFEEDEDDEGSAQVQRLQKSGNKRRKDSEMNDVLRALDAENDRLLNSSSRSPQPEYGSRRSGGNDLDDDSDDGRTYQPRMDRPRTAINFVSAKQRAMNRKTANKTMQRGRDLLQMLALDYISYDILDMPPVNEYDLYIRAFGSSNTRQAYVQTNDDNIEREVQTDEADVRQKWTQHPAEDFTGCGRGDGEKDVEEEEESQQKQNKEQDKGHLNKFLEKAGQVIAILLEEDKDEEGSEGGRSKTHIGISEGYTELDILPVLQGRHVVFSHFCPVQPNLLLTVYSPAPEVAADNPVSKRGIICVWNTNEPNYPQKILVCTSQPQCCCFSPLRPSLVFAGMVDGSIAMWDLRESSSLHRSTMVNDEAYSLRYPTYDTAAILTDENHHSPVASIVPIYSYDDGVTKSTSHPSQAQASEDSSSGLSFQLVSTEEAAIMHFWVVAEIGTPDLAGSQNDLGLAPGAQVKLLKSSSITLENPSKDAQMKAGLRARDTCLLPYDLNQFYVSTDSGSILHGVRFGKRAFPRAHTPLIETIVDVVCIDFSPFEQPCFLAGCSDGSFSLYHTKSQHPLMSWSTVTKGRAVRCVRWSTSRPCVFYVLDVDSHLYIFDLLEGDVLPKHEETISKEKVMSFSLTGDHKTNGRGTPGKLPQILFSMEGGRTEIHTVAQSLREPEQLETDYLASYLQRF